MRVIAGKYKGRKLFAGNDHSIRPTTDRVKEFIYSVLQDFVLDKRIADCFSGSGSLGIEALSRGATYVTFVESSNSSIDVLRHNLQSINIPESDFSIIPTSVEEFAKSPAGEPDIIFMDPPFHYPTLPALVENYTEHGSFIPGKLLVIEHETLNPLPEKGKSYSIFRQKKWAEA